MELAVVGPQKPLQAENVGIHKVGHMNKVPYTIPVGRRVAVTEHLHLPPLIDDRTEHQRNQVGFRPVMLTNLAVRIRTRYVEIPDRMLSIP